MADALPSDLAKVDPADAWKAWQPSTVIPWNRKWIAHLYRRAAFGPSPADTDRATIDGFEKTLTHLMTGDPDAAERLELLTATGYYYSDPVPLRVWWLYAMLEGGHPVREKLTLFWHNHFATSYSKVRSTKLMFQQNVTLRKHALGKFRPFLLDMSKDVAMLVWLDSNQNVKGRANENFAREVMELFSLGVGNYSEKDIQEAARAFTGWHVDTLPNRDDLTFQYNEVLHDDGPKTVFGKSGNLGGEDVVKLCCEKEACARFLVGKLYTFLVSETAPPKGLLTPLEDRFRKSDYDIADLVKAMLGSKLFFSEHAYRKRVKWPVEYAVGAVRSVVPGRVPLAGLANPLSKMGQALFAPPNVKGWRTGTDWLNSATLLARNNFAETVATGHWPRTSARSNNGPAFGKEATRTPPEAVPDMPEMLSLISPPGGVEGAATLVGPPEQIQAAAGVLGAPAVYAAAMPMGNDLPPAAGAGSAPVPGGPPKPPGPAPEPDAKFDPLKTLMATKPATISELVTRMGTLLYGEDVPASARGKIEKFLLDPKKPAAPPADTKEFRTKAREALHALMCLPEYQLS